MSGSNRGKFFALGLVAGIAIAFLFVVWAVPEFYQPSHHHEGYQNNQNADGKDGSSLWKRYISPFISSEDTLAQWVMAVFAAIATGVSIWAVALLRVTLAETRNAVKSADDAVAVTREIGQKQVRAYVVVNSAKYDWDKADEVVITVYIKNTGQSPASNIKMMGECFFDVYPAQNIPDHPIPEMPQSTHLGGGAELHGFYRLRGDIEEGIQLIGKGTHAMYVQGTIIYDDVFGETHFTRYRFCHGGRVANIRDNFFAYQSGNQGD